MISYIIVHLITKFQNSVKWLSTIFTLCVASFISEISNRSKCMIWFFFLLDLVSFLYFLHSSALKDSNILEQTLQTACRIDESMIITFVINNSKWKFEILKFMCVCNCEQCAERKKILRVIFRSSSNRNATVKILVCAMLSFLSSDFNNSLFDISAILWFIVKTFGKMFW